MDIIPNLDGMKLFQQYPDISVREPDILILGSGIGSMSAGACLAKYGYRVLLLEQHYNPGGLTHMFSRKGYKWETGVHGVGTVNENGVIKKIFDSISAKPIKWNSLGDIYEEIHFPSDMIEVHAGMEKHFEKLKEKFPDERKKIDDYARILKLSYIQSLPMYILKRFSKRSARIINKILGVFLKDWWNLTTKEVFDRLGLSQKLRAVVGSQCGYYGALPHESSFGIHSLVIDHYKNGSYYPSGGSKTITEGLLATIKNGGGDVVCGASVSKILFDKKSVSGIELDDGKQISCRKVISGIGAKATAKLCSHNPKLDAWCASINSVGDSPSYICMNIGLKGDIRDAGASERNRWYFSSLNTEVKTWDFENNFSPPIVYISFPSLKDPDHKGEHHTMEAITFVEWDIFSKWNNSVFGSRPEEYKKLKSEISDKFLEYLKSLMPGLMSKAEYTDLSTPLSSEHFVRSNRGAIYGLEATPARFRNQDLRTMTPVKGFFMTGVDTAAMGIAGGVVSGVLTASRFKTRILKLLV